MEGDQVQGCGVIGVDLDGHSGFKLLVCWLRARRLGDVSAEYTRNGFHIRVRPRGVYNPGARLDIRRCLGDDPARVEFDERRLACGLVSWVDTLFKYKKAGVSEGWFETWEFDPLLVAEPGPGRPAYLESKR